MDDEKLLAYIERAIRKSKELKPAAFLIADVEKGQRMALYHLAHYAGTLTEDERYMALAEELREFI